MRREVKQTVLKALRLHIVIQCEKTKHGTGKQVITIGPYKTALGGLMWAMYIGNERFIYNFMSDLASDFISHVGRDIAYESARDAINKTK